jgi:hypothetical protein
LIQTADSAGLVDRKWVAMSHRMDGSTFTARMAADHAVGRRRRKHLYNRVNFLSISKIYNSCVYFVRSAPSLIWRMVWTQRSYRRHATRQGYGGTKERG